MKALRYYVREILKEFMTCEPNFETEKNDPEKDLLTEPDEVADRDDDGVDEYSDAGAVAGYTLPLGASNSPTTLQQRGDIAGSGFGGAKPLKKKKKKKLRKGWQKADDSE